MQKTKILYIISDRNFGGGSRHLFDLISNLDKKFEPVLVSIPSPIIDRLKNKIKTYTVEMNSRLDFGAINNIRKIIKSEKPNLVHLHSTRAGILGTIAARKMNIPIIYTEHLFTKDYVPHNKLIHIYQIMVFKYLSKNITKTIAVSQAVKNYLVAENIFPKDKVEVIYHGVKIGQKLTANSQKLTVGSIGALNSLKGQKYLVEAVQNIGNVTLELIGEGPDLEKLKSLDKNHKVKFLGYQNDIYKFMKNWNIYVQPSLSESFGLSIAEAMGTGLPIIATNVGGIPELVDDCGILVPSKNTKSIADAIIKLIGDKKLRLELGKKSQQRIEEHFTIKIMMEKIEKLYEQLV